VADALHRGSPSTGCDLAYRVFLLAHIDAARARGTYDAFRRHFWIDRGFLAGFAEWPHGQELGEDVDSGPGFATAGWRSWGLGRPRESRATMATSAM
jgi:hypothetical protein